jgi:propionyl-CoA synthetase
VVDPSTGKELESGQMGQLVLKLPLPPGTLTGLLRNDEQYEKAYFSRFPGYYDTGDAGYVDEDGYVFVMARTDDVINVAGHRISSGALEEVLMFIFHVCILINMSFRCLLIIVTSLKQ